MKGISSSIVFELDSTAKWGIYSLLIALRNLERNDNFDNLVTGKTNVIINNPRDDY